MEILKKIFLFDVFPFLCRLIASTLFVLGLWIIGYPPQQELKPTAITLFIFSTFFFLIPVAKKLSIGKLLSFEREVVKVKEEVEEVKAETREFLNVYGSMITAITNTVSQTVNVNLPGSAEAEQAKEDLNESIETPQEPSSIEEEIDNFINEAGGDYHYALARLRMDLERTLREVLGKRTTTADPKGMKGKFISVRKLFKQFTDEFPKYKNMFSSFDYIIKVCNAAIHGQQVSEGIANEAIYMGVRMIQELKIVSKYSSQEE